MAFKERFCPGNSKRKGRLKIKVSTHFMVDVQQIISGVINLSHTQEIQYS